jgi:hypothetical protein
VETQDKSFWDDATPHLLRVYPDHFQGVSVLDLKCQFDHLVWDLRRKSSPEEVPVEEPKLPKYRFSWQEN